MRKLFSKAKRVFSGITSHLTVFFHKSFSRKKSVPTPTLQEDAKPEILEQGGNAKGLGSPDLTQAYITRKAEFDRQFGALLKGRHISPTQYEISRHYFSLLSTCDFL